MNTKDTVDYSENAIKVFNAFLKSKINEVNLLNAKLLLSNKLFRNHSLNESQKMKVIEINESNIKISKTGNGRIFQWKGHIEESVVLTNEELNEIVKIANEKKEKK